MGGNFILIIFIYAVCDKTLCRRYKKNNYREYTKFFSKHKEKRSIFMKRFSLLLFIYKMLFSAKAGSGGCLNV